MANLKFRKDFSYTKLAPTLVNENTDPRSEMARWVLEMNDVLYIDKCYVPGAKAIGRISGSGGDQNGPVLINTDALVYTPESIIRYLDQRNPPEKRLFPTGEAREKVQEWYDHFSGPFADFTMKYLFAKLLPTKRMGKALLKQKVKGRQIRKVKFSFKGIKRAIQKQYQYSSKPATEWLIELKRTFVKVDRLLEAGHTFLFGENLTSADIAFCAVAGQLLAPKEYGGANPKIEALTVELRQELFELRKTKAGQFALRLYEQRRPQPDLPKNLPIEPDFFARLKSRIQISLTGKQYKVFFFLQKRLPFIRIGFLKLAIVSRSDLVKDVLCRDLDFTVEEINGQKMANQNGAFYLGFDRNNPQFERELNFVRKATRKDDLGFIQNYVRSYADELASNALPLGKLDVPNTLVGSVLVGLMGSYLGVPGPTTVTMKSWCTDLFYDLFLNFSNNVEIHEHAIHAANARRLWILELIRERKAELREGKEIAENILNRMIQEQVKMKEKGWYDDEMLARNIGGLLTGMMATTSKAVVFVLQELFKRPDDLNGAIEAAKANDMKLLYGYVAECLRFNPVQPGVIRYSESPQFIQAEDGKYFKVKGKSKVVALTSGAMFTPSAFPFPRKFDPSRAKAGAVYMNWGYALHLCYGNHINMITIPELVRAVLLLPNVRPNKGRTGRGAGLSQGPFPTNYVVAFG